MDDADDPRFHFEIWNGPGASFGDDSKAIYYVENHNAQCGYGDLAVDFEIAASALLQVYRETGLGNWMAPCAHMVRQTLELRLKALLVSVRERDREVSARPLRGHSLMALWNSAIGWLASSGFPIAQDARMPRAVHLLSSFDAIDPSGDLFRFGISRKRAFKKQKSYDRVGIAIDTMIADFEGTIGFLGHWDAAVFRKTMAEEGDWKTDPFYDVNEFPRAHQPNR